MQKTEGEFEKSISNKRENLIVKTNLDMNDQLLNLLNENLENNMLENNVPIMENFYNNVIKVQSV